MGEGEAEAESKFPNRGRTYSWTHIVHIYINTLLGKNKNDPTRMFMSSFHSEEMDV